MGVNRVRKRKTLFLIALLAAAVAATAAEPPAPVAWLSTPTSDAMDQQIQVNGGGFPAHADVLLSLSDADGVEVETLIVAADEDGKISAQLAVDNAGQLLQAWELGGDSEEPVATAQIVPGRPSGAVP
jgi:hypothetical protein